MSIASRMKTYVLNRNSNTLDDYGIASETYLKVADISVSITKNIPTHDNTFPGYDVTSYIGITKYVGVELGDTLSDGTHTYKVKDIGSRGTVYQPLYLEKIQ